jgi:hypothetical protein
VFIPAVIQIRLSYLEYLKFITHNSDMIMQIDGKDSFEVPELSDHLKSEISKIDAYDLMDRIDKQTSQFKQNQSQSKQSLLSGMDKPYLERVKHKLYKIKYLK